MNNLADLELMLTGADRIEIAGYCTAAIQLQPSEEAMQEARDFVGSPCGLVEIASVRFSQEEKAAMAARTRALFSDDPTLPDRFEEAMGVNLALMTRAQDAEKQAREKQGCLDIAVRQLKDQDSRIGDLKAGKTRQAEVIQDLRAINRRLQIRSIWFACVALLVGIVAAYAALATGAVRG